MAYMQGLLVREFESGSNGCTCISQCGNDWGASYGSYQLTLRWGHVFDFLKRYFSEEYKQSGLYFNNLPDIQQDGYPGPEYCSAIETVTEFWNKMIIQTGTEAFEQKERDFVRTEYYEVTRGYINKGFHTDLNSLSPAWQDAFWSSAVRNGALTAYDYFRQLVTESTPVVFTQTNFDLYYDCLFQLHKTNRYKKGYQSGEREKLRSYLTDYIPGRVIIRATAKPVQVRWMQYRINKLINNGRLSVTVPLIEDGSWGSKTSAAVRALWKYKGWSGLGAGSGIGPGTIKVLQQSPGD